MLLDKPLSTAAKISSGSPLASTTSGCTPLNSKALATSCSALTSKDASAHATYRLPVGICLALKERVSFLSHTHSLR